MKKHYLILAILDLMILISSPMASQSREKDLLGLFPETPSINKQFARIRKLEEESPTVKNQYVCTVDKVADVEKSEDNTFTFDLYDNNYTVDFKTTYSFNFSYYLITKFSEPLELIQTKLDPNSFENLTLGKYDNITAGEIYFDKNTKTGTNLLNIELDQYNFGYKIGKIVELEKLKQILGNITNRNTVTMVCTVPKYTLDLIINYCIYMRNPHLGVYLKNARKFIDLKSDDNRCIWQNNMELKDDVLHFKVMTYRNTVSEKFRNVRKYNLSELQPGETKESCTFKKDELNGFNSILNCTFE